MEAKQTPLIELLERVPQDARLVVEHDQFSSSVHPVGRLCREAAAALRAALAEPCQCGDRPAAQCPGEWEPGCDLGNNPMYAKPLTEEEIQAIWAKTFEMGSSANTFARAIERAHGIGEQDSGISSC